MAEWSADTREVVDVLVAWGVDCERANAIGDVLGLWERPRCGWCGGLIDFTKPRTPSYKGVCGGLCRGRRGRAVSAKERNGGA